MAIEFSGDQSQKENEWAAGIFKVTAQVGDLIYSNFFVGSSINDPKESYDLSASMALVTQGSTVWQAYARLAAFAVSCRVLQQVIMGEPLESGLPGRVQFDFDGPSIIEPLEASYLEFDSGEASDSDAHDRLRILQFLRLALGNFLLAAGDKDRGLDWIRKLIGAKVPTTSPYHEQLDSLAIGAITHLGIGNFFDLERDDFLNLLLLQIEMNGTIVSDYIADRVVEKSASDWEDISESGESGFAYDGWVSLLNAVGIFQSHALTVSDSFEQPNLAPLYSTLHWAWRFGYISGRFACSIMRSQSDVDTANPVLWNSIVNRLLNVQSTDGFEAAQIPLISLLSLLDCFGVETDWEFKRQHYLEIWRRLQSLDLSTLDDFSPTSDLYWAMKVGFADGCLVAPHYIVPLTEPADPGALMLKEILDRMETMSLRGLRSQVKVEQLLENLTITVSERLPASTQQIKRFVDEQLGETCRSAHAGVRRAMIKAERYYRTQIDEDDSKLWFAKGVEGTIRHHFVDPLIEFNVAQGIPRVQLYFRDAVQDLSFTGLKGMSLADWGSAWEIAGSAGENTLLSIQTGHLRQFVRVRFGEAAMKNLGELSTDLKRIQFLRNPSGHYQPGSGISDVEEMRKMVLGIGTRSIITRLMEIL